MKSDIRIGVALKKELGFSLVEMLVALAITSMVMVLVFGMMFFQMRSYDREGMLTEAQQNVRVAMDMAVRDVRMAGSGLPKVPFYVGSGGDASRAVYPVSIVRGAYGTGGAGNLLNLASDNANVNDSIIIFYVDDTKPLADTTLQADMLAASDPIFVPQSTANVASGFATTATDDGTTTPFIITDGLKADLFLVTGFEASGTTSRLVVNDAGPNNAMYNATGAGNGHNVNFQAGAPGGQGYRAGSKVKAVRVVRYGWGPTLTNYPFVFLVNGDTTRDDIADYLGTTASGPDASDASNAANQAVSIEYSTKALSASPTAFVRGMPADPYDISAIRITLTAQTPRAVDQGVPRTRTLSTDVQPRSYTVF